MNHRIAAGLSSFALLGACSLINAPESLESGSGGGSTGATSSSGGKGNTAGSKSQGGDNGTGGTAIGMGGCGLECGEGGAPPLGRDCDISGDDCGSTAPICDAAEGVCRPCGGNAECTAELGVPYCLTTGANAGRCAECRTSADCADATPICNAVGSCRLCAAHEECISGVCGETGTCASEGQTVYVLAQTGSDTAACGTSAEPCGTVAHAATKLSAERPNLVLVETIAVFEYESVSLPAVQGLRVIGNGVTVQSSGGMSIFRVPAGASVIFDNVVLEGVVDDEEAGIECVDADITVRDSTLRDNSMGVFATGCDVTVTRSLIQHNAVPLNFSAGGLVVGCAAAGCNKRLLFTQNRFIDNGVALYVYGQLQATIENNLFLRNGADGYTRVIELRAAQTRFAYNTLVENFNSCDTYIEVVACHAGVCDYVGNISSGSYPNAAEPCYDNVWTDGGMTYSLTEITHPGSTNKVGDPLFVDAVNGDFTPGPGSPAIDGGNPADAPMVDIDGNPRGAAPDMGAFEAN